MATPLQRALADVRFFLLPPPFAPGNIVETTVPIQYHGRLSDTHLPAVPAGTRGIIRALAPMPGAPGGAILDILDMAGKPSGYWTGASVADLRVVRTHG